MLIWKKLKYWNNFKLWIALHWTVDLAHRWLSYFWEMLLVQFVVYVHTCHFLIPWTVYHLTSAGKLLITIVLFLYFYLPFLFLLLAVYCVGSKLSHALLVVVCTWLWYLFRCDCSLIPFIIFRLLQVSRK